MSAASKFRKKPVVIDAIRFDGSNGLDVLRFADNDNFGLIGPEDRVEDPEITAAVYDKLHSTWVGVKTGQWIIKGVQGEFCPCDPDVFAATYEPVGGAL